MTGIEEEYAARARGGSDIWAHLPYLRERGTGTVIELGVRSGNSTSAFLAAGADLWSCDINKPQVPDEWRSLPNWHFIRGWSWSPAVHLAMPRWCDALFIDTSHEFTDTMCELRIYAPRVRPGGVVLMHDTEYGEREVARALDRYCKENRLKWSNRGGCFGLGVIEIPADRF